MRARNESSEKDHLISEIREELLVVSNDLNLPPSLVEVEDTANYQVLQGKYHEAVKTNKKALALDPDRSVLWGAKAYAHLGKAIIQKFELNKI